MTRAQVVIACTHTLALIHCARQGHTHTATALFCAIEAAVERDYDTDRLWRMAQIYAGFTWRVRDEMECAQMLFEAGALTRTERELVSIFAE